MTAPTLRPLAHAGTALLAVVLLAAGGGTAAAADLRAPVAASCAARQPAGTPASPQYKEKLDERYDNVEARIAVHNAQKYVFGPQEDQQHRAYDAEAKSLNQEVASLTTRASDLNKDPALLVVQFCRPPQQIWGGPRIYGRGGMQTAIQHVQSRHGWSSTAVRVSNFLPTAREMDIRAWVDHVWRDPRSVTKHDGGVLGDYKIIGPAGTFVGTAKSDANGRRGPPVDHIQIHVQRGEIQTAFPVEGP